MNLLFHKIIRIVKQSCLYSTVKLFCHIVPAILFSVFIVGAKIYREMDVPGNMLNHFQIATYVLQFIGCFIIFFILITLFYEYLDDYSIKNLSVKDSKDNKLSLFDRIVALFYCYPFRSSVIFLLICYIPYIILCYPGIFMGDTGDQIAQGYNLVSYHPLHYYDLQLITEKVKLFNHHPIAHTKLLHWFIVLGNTIINYSFGVFLYIVFQMLFFIGTVSYGIRLLVKNCQIKPFVLVSILIYFAVHPLMQNYVAVLTKDSVYVSFFLVFLGLCFLYLKQGCLSRKQFLAWLFSILGVVLFRNEGIYLVVPVLGSWLLLGGQKRKIGMVLFATIAFYWSWHHLFFPAFNVTPGSVREMLCIPFQQTARYVKYNSSKVTKEERTAINAVLDYNSLSERYDPNWADPVKNRFKEKSTSEERKEYIKTWFNMFVKEPGIYFDAIIANKYKYFTPGFFTSGDYRVYLYGEASQRRIKSLNKRFSEVKWKFRHPKKLNEMRKKYEKVRDKMFSLPVLKVFLFSSTYVWFVILIAFYIIRNKLKLPYLLLIPCLIQILVLLAGPRNGTHSRYIYPLAAWLPFIFLFVMDFKE